MRLPAFGGLAATINAAQVTLGQRQLFMLPTRHGLFFSLLVFTLLLAAINYENGLVYSLTFLLAAMAVVSMLYTHRNLLGLRVLPGPCPPVFVGEPAAFAVCLYNDSNGRRLGLNVAHDKKEIGRVDLEPSERACLRLQTPATQRGYLAMPPVVVSTQFPLGLLYSWSRRIVLDHRCLVYPRPGPKRPILASRDQDLRHELGSQTEGDDFIGVREFLPGDSPRHVDWKAVARGQGMHTKRFGGEQRSIVWLDWGSLDGLDAESRLSQLCRWVLDADAEGDAYGLRIPGTTLNPGSGEAHRHACLRALALFEA